MGSAGTASKESITLSSCLPPSLYLAALTPMLFSFPPCRPKTHKHAGFIERLGLLAPSHSAALPPALLPLSSPLSCVSTPPYQCMPSRFVVGVRQEHSGRHKRSIPSQAKAGSPNPPKRGGADETNNEGSENVSVIICALHTQHRRQRQR